MAKRVLLYPLMALIAVSAMLTTASIPSASAKTLSPVKIMVVAPIDTTTDSLIEVPAAVQAAAKQINHEGGLKGHPIQVITCSDQNQPNAATQCAEQAVSDGVIAVVGSWSTFSNDLYPALATAGIVQLGETPLTAADFSNPLSYPITAGTIIEFSADGVLAARAGCKTIASVGPNQPQEQLVFQGTKAGADSVNPKITMPSVFITDPVTDYAPAISQAIADGADCLIMESPPQDASRVMTAIQQSGHSLKVFGSTAQFTPSSLTGSLGTFSNGKIFATDPQAVPNTDPALKAIAKAIKAVNPKATLDSFSLNSWGATQLLKLASAHMTTFTPKALAAALNGLGTVNLGYYAPFSFSKGLNVTGFNRLFNLSLYGLVFRNGQYVPAQTPNKMINVRSFVAKGL
jgi:ABC-type branched-subunit amino acid transport system substrate-binding protein